ncbi:hypothetical protein LS81_010990 [Helicobacter trogontum]|uniref:Uncharacterized protein n=1 Tax=Helicobacter trogontum TaxID=50960 RepID=A0A4U8RZN2_9HELI|nr:hypothetical protein [Helicobacter trogontum]TLD78753.1 hypothetical protein LS81_010990 [Helicobacter trogontum]
MTKDNKQIREIWDDITEGAEILEEKLDRKGEYMIKRRRLSDGTIIQLRKKSSGGAKAKKRGKEELEVLQ